MRRFLLTALAGAAVLAPAPLLAQDAETTRRLMRSHVASSYIVLTDILARRAE